MPQLNYSQLSNLEAIAKCWMLCFPDSYNTKLGKKFVMKSLQWFLQSPNKFLYHIQNGEEVIGFCGGFIPQYYGDGSSSGMLQFAFKQAVVGILKNPFILMDRDLRKYYSFIIRNIKKKIGISKTTAVVTKPINYIHQPIVSLVVIGVHPKFRGQGYFEELMKEFEKNGYQHNIFECILTVKKNNIRAINAYQKLGWQIKNENEETLTMQKNLL